MARAAGWRVAAFAAALALSGCSSVVDSVPTALGGLPEGVPQRPAGDAAYPAVHDMPPARQDGALSEAERNRLRDELKDTRDRVTRPDTIRARSNAGTARNP
jgi:hypothetical protein